MGAARLPSLVRSREHGRGGLGISTCGADPRRRRKDVLMAGRGLVSIRRRVEEDQGVSYEEAWRRLAETVGARGAHAWRFRSEQDPALFVEFLEFGAGADPRDDPSVARALEALEMIGRGDSEGWIDAEDSSRGERR